MQRHLAESAVGVVAARFVDGRGAIADRYPANPNGSPRARADGRAERHLGVDVMYRIATTRKKALERLNIAAGRIA